MLFVKNEDLTPLFCKNEDLTPLFCFKGPYGKKMIPSSPKVCNINTFLHKVNLPAISDNHIFCNLAMNISRNRAQRRLTQPHPHKFISCLRLPFEDRVCLISNIVSKSVPLVVPVHPSPPSMTGRFYLACGELVPPRKGA